MKNILAALLLWASLLSAAPSDAPIDPWVMQAQLGHGFDVSWAEFKVKIEGYGPDEISAMKVKGFKTARIRTALAANDTLFGYLDRCIKDCLDSGIVPIIAYNAIEYELAPSPENLAIDADWWEKVSAHYADYPHTLLFNLNIEWTDSASKDSAFLTTWYEAVTPKIRATNPTRILIYSPMRISNPEYLPLLAIPASAGSYVMAEWHFYAAGPSRDSTSPKYWTTGTDAQKQLITDKIDLAAAWQQSRNIPTWVGAWMAGDYNKGNGYTPDEQAVFAAYMVSQLDSAGIPWAINTIDKFYNYTDNMWIDSMLPVVNALATPSDPTPVYTTSNNPSNQFSFKDGFLSFPTIVSRRIEIFSLSGRNVFLGNVFADHLRIMDLIHAAGVYTIRVCEAGKNIQSLLFVK